MENKIKDKTGKMKKLSVSLLFGVLSVLVLMGFVIGVSNSENVEYGPNYEITCDGGVCESVIYSYDKYWFDSENNKWEEIKTDFTDNCGSGYDYCVDDNLYNVYLKKSGKIQVLGDGSEFSFKMGNLVYRNEKEEEIIGKFNGKNIVVENNVVEYEDAYGKGLNLRFTYLPDKLKQELIIEEESLPVSEIGGNVNLNLEHSILKNEGNLLLDMPFVFDSAGETYEVSYSSKESKDSVDKILVLETPYDLLENMEYPVVIDPTVVFSGSEVAWNGAVYKKGNQYIRWSNHPFLRIGEITPVLISARGGIDWNISSLDDEANILDVTLEINAERLEENSVINITEMQGNSFSYSDDFSGNQDFYNDMADGPVYAGTSNLLEGLNSFVFSQQGKNDLKSSLSSDIFSVGLSPNLNAKTWISSKDNPDFNKRPKLIVNYNFTFANETEADEATEQGIKRAILEPEIHKEQKVYFVSSSGAQSINTFDRLTTYESKTWGFNYISGNEQFSNAGNVSSSFFVSEMTNLTALQVRDDVEQFIVSTI